MGEEGRTITDSSQFSSSVTYGLMSPQLFVMETVFLRSQKKRWRRGGSAGLQSSSDS